MSAAVIREIDPTEKGWKFVGREGQISIWERPDGSLYAFPPGAREVLIEFIKISDGQILRLVKM